MIKTQTEEKFNLYFVTDLAYKENILDYKLKFKNKIEHLFADTKILPMDSEDFEDFSLNFVLFYKQEEVNSATIEIVKDDFLKYEVAVRFYLDRKSSNITLEKRNKFESNDEIEKSLQKIEVSSKNIKKKKNKRKKN
jgi:hypothetical protein